MSSVLWAQDEIIIVKPLIRPRKGRSSLSANIILSVIFKEDIDNRRVRLECISEDFERASEEQIQPDEQHSIDDDGFREVRFEFYLERGEYECKATLTKKSENGNGGNHKYFSKTRVIVGK